MRPQRIEELLEEAETVADEDPAEAFEIYLDAVAIHEELGHPLDDSERLELSFKMADAARRGEPLKVARNIYTKIIEDYSDDRLIVSRAAYELGCAYMDALEWERAVKSLNSSLAYMTRYVAERQYFTAAEFALGALINLKLNEAKNNISAI